MKDWNFEFFTLKNLKGPTSKASNGLKILQTQSGSALLILLLFLSSVGLFFLGPLSKMLATLQRTQTQLHLCRDAVYRSQQEASQDLNRLMSLNYTAKTLRVARKAAELAATMAKLSGEPFTIAKTQAALKVITTSQAALKATQQTHLLKIQGLWTLESLRVRQKLQKKGASFVIVRSPQLPVRPDRTPDPAPIYEVRKDFFKRTSWHVSWRDQHSDKRFPQDKLKARFLRSCSASLTYDKNNWDYIPTEDKSWSKLSSSF